MSISATENKEVLGVNFVFQVELKKYAFVSRSAFGLYGRKKVAVLRASGENHYCGWNLTQELFVAAMAVSDIVPQSIGVLQVSVFLCTSVQLGSSASLSILLHAGTRQLGFLE